MITIRRSNERGGGDYGWLKTRHTFSFTDYLDEKWMGFRSLRVINEDWVGPSGGFPRSGTAFFIFFWVSSQRRNELKRQESDTFPG